MTTEEAQSLIGRTGRILVPPGSILAHCPIRTIWGMEKYRVVGYETAQDLDPTDDARLVAFLLVEPAQPSPTTPGRSPASAERVYPAWFIPNPTEVITP